MASSLPLPLNHEPGLYAQEGVSEANGPPVKLVCPPLLLILFPYQTLFLPTTSRKCTQATSPTPQCSFCL